MKEWMKGSDTPLNKNRLYSTRLRSRIISGTNKNIYKHFLWSVQTRAPDQLWQRAGGYSTVRTGGEREQWVLVGFYKAKIKSENALKTKYSSTSWTGFLSKSLWELFFSSETENWSPSPLRSASTLFIIWLLFVQVASLGHEDYSGGAEAAPVADVSRQRRHAIWRPIGPSPLLVVKERRCVWKKTITAALSRWQKLKTKTMNLN